MPVRHTKGSADHARPCAEKDASSTLNYYVALADGLPAVDA